MALTSLTQNSKRNSANRIRWSTFHLEIRERRAWWYLTLMRKSKKVARYKSEQPWAVPWGVAKLNWLARPRSQGSICYFYFVYPLSSPSFWFTVRVGVGCATVLPPSAAEASGERGRSLCFCSFWNSKKRGGGSGGLSPMDSVHKVTDTTVSDDTL